MKIGHNGIRRGQKFEASHKSVTMSLAILVIFNIKFFDFFYEIYCDKGAKACETWLRGIIAAFAQ